MNKIIIHGLEKKKYISYNLMDDNDRVYDFDEFNAKQVSNGRFRLRYKNIVWNCFLGGDVKNQEELLVSFSGAGAVRARPTRFDRWSWHEDFSGRFLSIDDPMYEIYNVQIGWYFGNKTEDYCNYVADIVNKIKNDIKAKEVFFYGSSSGGTAAIRVANILHYGTVFVINPQLIIRQYPYKEEIENIIKKNLEDDELNRDMIIEKMLDTENKNVRYVIAENIRSSLDVNQLASLCCKCSVSDVKFGMNQLRHNILLWTYEAYSSKDPHVLQDWHAMLPVILHVCNEFKKGNVSEDLLLAINSLWYDYYNNIFIKQARDSIFYIGKDINEFQLIEEDIYNNVEWHKIYQKNKLYITTSDEKLFTYKLPIKDSAYKITLQCSAINFPQYIITISNDDNLVLCKEICYTNKEYIYSFVIGYNIGEVYFSILSNLRDKNSRKIMKINNLCFECCALTDVYQYIL